MSDLVALCSAEGGDVMLKNFVSSNGENDLVLHEFFFTSNIETNKYAIKLFIQKNFHVSENEIEVLPTGNTKALIFKFSTQLNAPKVFSEEESQNFAKFKQNKNLNGNSVYFLSVLSELDLLHRQEHRLVELLRKHASRDCNNTFLFVAYPRGENGFNKAIQLPESDLRKLGRTLREDIDKALKKTDISIQGVDLMLSRPSHPPLYTQYDFSAKEKLELYRLPKSAVDVSVSSSSPFLLFKYNDNDVIRIFVRCLVRDVASVLVHDEYSFAK